MHAGATADAFTLFERLEMQLEAHPGACRGSRHAAVGLLAYNPACYIRCTFGTAGQLTRAAVELAKLWRTDKYLRRLDVRCLPRLVPVMCFDAVLAWVLCCTGSVNIRVGV